MAVISEELQVILNATNNTTAAFNALNKNLTGLKSLALQVAGTLATAFAIRGIVSATDEWAVAVERVQAVTGLQAQQAARLAFVAKKVGVDSGELVTGLDRLAHTMFSNSVEADKGKDAFSKWGLAIKNADGSTRNINDVLFDAAGKVKTFGNNADATALEIDLFGKAGGRLHQMLMLGAEGMKAIAKEGDALGFSNAATIAGLKEFHDRMLDLGDAMDGLKISLGVAILPLLRQFVDWIRKTVQDFNASTENARVLAGTIKVLGEVFGKALGVLKGFAEWLGEIWTKLKGIFGTVGAVNIAADLLVLALAGIAGGPVVLAIAAVVLAFGQVKETIEFIQKNWDKFVFALKTGRLNDIPVFGFFFGVIQRAINFIEGEDGKGGLKGAFAALITFFSTDIPQFGGIWDAITWLLEAAHKIFDYLAAIPGLLSSIPVVGPVLNIASGIGSLLQRNRPLGGSAPPPGPAAGPSGPASGLLPQPGGGFIDRETGAFFPGGQNFGGMGGVTINNSITVEGSVTTDDGLAARLASRVGNAIVGTSLTHGRGFDY